MKRNYSLGEEISHSISHGFGAIFSIVGMIIMIIHSHNALEVTTSVLFNIFFFYYYVMSCVYHAIHFKCSGKSVLERLDYTNSLLLIPSAFTPIILCSFSLEVRFIFLIILWCVSLFFIVWKINHFEKSSIFEVLFHLFYVWCAIIIVIFHHHYPVFGLELMIGGGVLYSLGILIDKLFVHYHFVHLLSHIFFLVFHAFFYFFIYNYIFI